MNITYLIDPNTNSNKYLTESSGYIAKALEKRGCKITYLNLPLRKYDVSTVIKQVFRKNILRTFADNSDHDLARKQALKISELIKINTDIIFSTLINPVAYLSTNIPIVVYSDNTFSGKNYLEQSAILNSDLAIFSTEWSAKNAMSNYRIDPLKIAVIPFGANINEPISIGIINNVVKHRRGDILKLLFVSTHWDVNAQRALDITEALNERGLPTELHIYGVGRNYPVKSKHIIKHEVEKTKINRNFKLTELIKDCHFLFLPELNDCASELFSRANAYGLPVITTNTKGNDSIIKDNLNGIVFPEDALPDTFTNYIQATYLDYEAYESLCLTSFDEYQNHLNWDTAAVKIIGLLERVKLVNELWTFGSN